MESFPYRWVIQWGLAGARLCRSRRLGAAAFSDACSNLRPNCVRMRPSALGDHGVGVIWGYHNGATGESLPNAPVTVAA